VFVHCHAGISRSATICIAYIMKTMQWDLSRAYEFVKQRRPCISPNLHFMGQLLEFQKRLLSGTQEEQSNTHEPNARPPSSASSASISSLYRGVSLHNIGSPVVEEPDSSCWAHHCSNTTSVPSASAPSSLNLEPSHATCTNTRRTVTLPHLIHDAAGY